MGTKEESCSSQIIFEPKLIKETKDEIIKHVKEDNEHCLQKDDFLSSPKIQINILCREPQKKQGETDMLNRNPTMEQKQIKQEGTYSQTCTDHENDKELQCPFCDRKFSQPNQLREHLRSHGSFYQCSLCNASFDYKHCLVEHMNSHPMKLRNYQYKCNQCEANYVYEWQLITHRRIHTGEKPFKCEKCDQKFTHKFQYVNHMREHEGILSKQMYECDECGAIFSLLRHLRIHKRLYHADKSFKCDKCQAAFRCFIHLKSHLNFHEKEKRYMCSQCDVGFNLKRNLKRHMEVAHSGKNLNNTWE